MSGPQYLASDDSALLREVLRQYSGRTCLEIGAGNGGTLLELSKRFSLAVGTDLLSPSMDDWKGAGADLVIADAATCFRDEEFDLVAFNPPYLPEDVKDGTTQGGRDLEVPKAFLREALRVVRRSGKVVFLLNQEARLAEFGAICSAAGFRVEKKGSRKLFFEELSVYEASPLSA